MKTFLTALLVFSVASLWAQTNYYVSPTGDDSHTGLSEAQAWKTITHAVSATSPVSAGDIVNVKAGDYGAEHLVFEKSGTAGSPITFEGYKNTPGDQPNLNYNFGDPLDATVMPLLDGVNRATSGSAMELESVSYIVIKNFQVKHYQQAVYSRGAHHLSIENVITLELGDVDANYDGGGFSLAVDGDGLGGYSNQLKNCIVTNAAAEGISIAGNDNIIDNCKIYCNDNSTVNASTDYYIVVAGNNNYITGCYVERIGDLEHAGAGIGVKEDAENNLFENCVAKDLKNGGFYARYLGAKHNEFRHCQAIGTLDDVLGFLIRDGASYNTFNSCSSESCTDAVAFMDTGENGGAHYCGRHNTFNNCLFQNATVAAIRFDNYEVASPADSNLFANCVFNQGTTFATTNRKNKDNRILNCIINGYANLSSGTESLDMDFTYCDFYNSFPTPSGTGNISADPKFVDAANGDYHLQSTSSCIDAGIATDAPGTDYEGTVRPQGAAYDIGAYERSSILPVEWTDFDVSAIKNCQGVRLRWTTETETNTKWFDVERSMDLAHWQRIARLPAKGQSAERVQYELEDKTAQKSQTWFYRFKEVDLDGQVYISSIKTIRLACAKKEINIFPNPCHGVMHLTPVANGNYLIRDAQGRCVKQGALASDIDIFGLPIGVYAVQIIVDNQVYVKKLFVSE